MITTTFLFKTKVTQSSDFYVDFTRMQLQISRDQRHLDSSSVSFPLQGTKFSFRAINFRIF